MVARVAGPMGQNNNSNNANRRSVFLELLAFMEEVTIYEQIMAGDGGRPAGGPYPWCRWDNLEYQLRMDELSE